MAYVISSLQSDERGNILIYTADDFVKFCTYYNAGSFSANTTRVFHLMNDIDLSGITISMINNFTHTFNGHGNTISNIVVGDLNTEYAGIFKTNNGTIRDLTTSGTITGKNYVGGIAGYNIGGTIYRCINKCSIVTSTTSTSASTYAGGIAGANANFSDTQLGSIYQCCNLGSVTGSIGIGGIAGLFSSGNILNCYNAGTVSGTSVSTGGIVGQYVIGSIKYCFNATAITCTASTYGGIVGDYTGTDNAYSLTDCFYLTGTATKGFGTLSIADAANVVEALTSDKFILSSSFTGYDFTDVWMMASATWNFNETNLHTYPYLKYELTWDPVYDDSWFDATTDFQYVRTADQLIALATIIKDKNSVLSANTKYKIIQRNDIDFKGKMYNSQIGKTSVPFSMFYSGEGHKIKNLVLRSVTDESTTLENTRATGLFGYNSGMISDLVFVNCQAYSDSIGTSIVAEYNNGTIAEIVLDECYTNSLVSSISTVCNTNYQDGVVYNILAFNTTINNKVNLNSTSVNVYSHVINHLVSGIIATNYGCCFNCMNYSTINSLSDNVGGIVAKNYGIVAECNDPERNFEFIINNKAGIDPGLDLSEYFIYGHNNVGGIVGYNVGSVTLCTNMHSVSANLYTGGIVGYNTQYKNSSYGIISTGEVCCSRNKGNITSTTSDGGGIVGRNFGGKIHDCYSGYGRSLTCPLNTGGIVGYNNGSVGHCYSTMSLPTSYTNYIGSIIGYLDTSVSNDTFISYELDTCYAASTNSSLLTIGGNATTTTSYDIASYMVTTTSVNLKLQSTYSGWDFDNLWDINNNEYPNISLSFTRATRNIVPRDNNYQSIGNYNKKFRSVYASEFVGKMNMSNLYVSPTSATTIIVMNGGTSSSN